MTFFPHLEIQVVEHCNLNCASCTHFSPLAEPSFMDKQDFYDQLCKAGKIFCGHCKSLKIMGGEPMLHPEIGALLGLARKAMPSERITLQTNGTLLERAPEGFWRSCSANQIRIRVTRYPVPLDVEAINALAVRYGAELTWHPDNSVVKSFNLYPLDVHGLCDPAESFRACRMKKRYVLIKNHRLYPCPIAGNSEHFARQFSLPVCCGEADSVSPDAISSFDEYAAFAEESIPFCRFCRSGAYLRDIGWKVSEKKLEEWT